jgi:hypothetical protein
METEREYIRPADLAALLGNSVLPDAKDVEQKARSEALQKSRHVDLTVSAELRSRGWTQIGPLDGLSWCVVCDGPTVWLDAARQPRHHTCLEEGI